MPQPLLAGRESGESPTHPLLPEGVALHLVTRPSRATTMLPLDSSQWQNLTHAYGAASDTPGMLRGLTPLSRSIRDEEPWFGIWSALAHQGDVYTASYAAV